MPYRETFHGWLQNTQQNFLVTYLLDQFDWNQAILQQLLFLHQQDVGYFLLLCILHNRRHMARRKPFARLHRHTSMYRSLIACAGANGCIYPVVRGK